MRKKLIRVTTVSSSLDALLKGQLKFLGQYYDVVGVASDVGTLDNVSKRENIRTIDVSIQREINIKKDIKSLISLIKLLRKEKPNIVHANTPKGSLLSMVAAWITRVPHRVYTVTGLRFETTSGRFRRLLILMEKITCACATKVIPEGDGVKETLIREEITKKPLQKILNGNINGIDLNYFNRSSSIVQTAMNIKSPTDAFTFCFVGRIVKDKGINELVNAFNMLNKEHKKTHLILVGPFEKELDPVEPQTEELISNHENISFVGYQNDIRPYLAASDAFVFPSYREGFPNVVLQAGAMELPSIVTDINGCNEIIIDGENGKIIPPQDTKALYKAMKYFVEHKDDLVKHMATNARPMIESRFDQKMVWNAILDMYNSLN